MTLQAAMYKQLRTHRDRASFELLGTGLAKEIGIYAQENLVRRNAPNQTPGRGLLVDRGVLQDQDSC